MVRCAAGLLVAIAALSACSSNTVLVSVPPRMDLKSYGTLGIVDFSSNAEPAIAASATHRFEEQVQAAQPGTPFLELGDRAALLSSVGAAQLDSVALKKIGQKYGVRAVFVGDIAYSQPRMEVKVVDITKLDGGMQAEMRGDISSRLMDTATGASVWSSSAWARRQIGSMRISAERGLSGAMSRSDPREDMLPALLYHLTEDFRPTSVREAVR